MDTRTAAGQVDQAEVQVQLIKEYMPKVHAAIRAKSAEIGKEAFALVRRGARGEPDCFYAFEGGRVVGTPFCQAVTADVAVLMVEFGVGFVCVWPLAAGKGDDGAN
jgi:hypothetical protein